MVAIVDVKDGSFLIRCTQRDSWDGDNELFSSLAWFIFSIPFIHVTLSRALLELHYTSWTCAWCERTFIYIWRKPAYLPSSPQWFNNLWTWVQNQHYIYTYIYNNWGHIYTFPLTAIFLNRQHCKVAFSLLLNVEVLFTNSTTSLIPLRLYLFINSQSSIASKTFRLDAAVFRFFVNSSYWVKSPLEGF